MSKNQQRKGQEFLCKVRYKNQLPDIPFPAKLLEIKDTDDLVSFQQTPFIQNLPIPLLTENDLDLQLETLALSPHFILDQNLHAPDTLADMNDDQVSTRHRPIVPWLRRTEYISAGEGSRILGRSGLGDLRRHVQQKRKSITDETSIDLTMEGQLRMVENSFGTHADIHPFNDKLFIEESCPLLANKELWSMVLTSCSVDESLKNQSKAFLKPLSNANDQFMVYFGSDADQNLTAEEQYTAQGLFDFRMNKEPEMQKFFIQIIDGVAYYAPISARIQLQKRRKTKNELSDLPTDLQVTRRPLSEEEELSKRIKLDSLLAEDLFGEDQEEDQQT